MAETRIGDVPRPEAGEAECDEGEKRQADCAANLPACKCLKAVPRIGQRELCG
jgi:hypothetical protein